MSSQEQHDGVGLCEVNDFTECELKGGRIFQASPKRVAKLLSLAEHKQ